MSTLGDLISKDLVEAMKARDEAKVSTLRLLSAAFHNKQIELGHELSHEEELDVVAKAAKQRRESIDAYKKGGRDDLAAKEQAELDFLTAYLPQQLGEEETAKIVDEVIGELGASGTDDFGKVIGEVMKRVRGKADGSVVSRMVRDKLA